MNYTTDCLIIGSGAAGLTLALGLADKTKVIVLSKENVCAGSTNYAQGGIAGVYNIKDDNDNLKEMDQILEEMAEKWKTLSKDEQTALAQTVAGTRQRSCEVRRSFQDRSNLLHHHVLPCLWLPCPARRQCG